MTSTAPNMGLKYAWALGTYFKDDMDANIKKLDRFYMPVLSATIGTPPGSPNNGDRYIIPNTGATGAWVGNETKIATRVAGAWEYDVPHNGMRLYDLETEEVLIYDSVGGGSSDGSWISEDINVLRSMLSGAAIIDMDANDYIMTNAQAYAPVKVIVDVGVGKTCYVPATTDSFPPADMNIVSAFAGGSFYISSESGGGPVEILSPYNDVCSYFIGGSVSMFNSFSLDADYDVATWEQSLRHPSARKLYAKIQTLADRGSVNRQSGASYTLAAADAFGLVYSHNSTAQTIHIEHSGVVDMGTDCSVRIQVAEGAGSATVVTNDTAMALYGNPVITAGNSKTLKRDANTEDWYIA